MGNNSENSDFEIVENQTRIYKKLHSIGKNLNESLKIDELYDIATNFVIDELHLEKCLIFEHDDKNGWFKVVKSIGYDNTMEQKIIKIISLLLSGEVIEYLRLSKKAIIHTPVDPNEYVNKLIKSLFLSEAYFELFGGDIEIPHSLIVAGNGIKDIEKFTTVDNDIIQLALGNFTMQLSNTINNILFYEAWNKEKELLEENIKHRTKELNEQKETFEAIYNTSKDGIALLDFETTAFLDVNPAYCDMTGFTKAELLRTSCIKLSVEGDREKSKEAISKVLKDGYIKNFIKTCIKKDGNYIIVSMSISLMNNGKEMLVSVKDITKQQAIEKEVIVAHKKIKDSIKFASIIQQAILPSIDIISNYTNDYFIKWIPKDVVGGDIYFVVELDSKEEVLFMVLDGAGHGVPGAFVTMIVKAIETQIVARIKEGALEPKPSKILEYFNRSLKTMLKQEKGSKSNAGFDGGVLYYNKNTKECRFSGAKTDLYLINNNKLDVICGDKKNVGFIRTKIDQKYTEHIVNLEKESKLYLSTDGLYDQEGENKSRYGLERFEKLLIEINGYSFEEQSNIVIDSFNKFKGKINQTDDLTIIGINFK